MITIYSTQTCAFCGQVEKYMQSKGVEYQKVYIDDDVKTRQYLLDRTGALTVPITTDGERYVVGWKPAELRELIGE